MTSVRPAALPAITTRGVSEWFGQAAQIVAGISVASYAFGWTLTATLYGGLGVDPEEIGITFDWLAIRAFLVGLLGLVVVLSARKLLHLARRSGQPVTLVLHRPVATALALLVVCLGTAGVIGGAYVAWFSPEGVDPTGTVLAVVACAVLIGLFVWLLRPSSLRVRWHGRSWFHCGAGIAVAFLLTIAASSPFLLANRLLAEVRAGRAVSIEVLGVRLIKIENVRVSSADPSKPSPVTDCALRLGSGAGTSIFVAGGKVIRAADQNISVITPC